MTQTPTTTTHQGALCGPETGTGAGQRMLAYTVDGRTESPKR
jgi:hypothetical protein